MMSMVVSPTREFHALGSHGDVALRHAAHGIGRALQRRVPVQRAHDDFRAVPALQERGALVVIAVRVADEHVLDVVRIEAERLHAVDDLGVDRVIEQRVDYDDALARRERPGGVDQRAHEVEVVEHLVGLRVPRRPIGHRTRAGERGRLSGGEVVGCDTDAKERPCVIRSRRAFGGGDETIGRDGCGSLRVASRGAKDS